VIRKKRKFLDRLLIRRPALRYRRTGGDIADGLAPDDRMREMLKNDVCPDARTVVCKSDQSKPKHLA
jgi:hypothetical protein